MQTLKLAIAGTGNVTKALLHLLERKRGLLRDDYGVQLMVSGIASGSRGCIILPEGITPARLSPYLEGKARLEIPGSLTARNTVEMIEKADAQIFIENTPVNYHTGQPAADHIRAALEAEMHAITANKGPVAVEYNALRQLARRKNRHFLFESSVMDGAPIFSLFRGALPGTRLLAFRAILNSTTNLILSLMEGGSRFEDAVLAAQKAGLAETDPSGDIDGWDSAVKVAVLARVLMDSDLRVEDVQREGIRGITPGMLAEAAAAGERYKLICELRQEGGRLVGRVSPQRVAPSSPFYAINGATSIIQFETDTLSKLALIEHDPTPDTTAYGEFADLLQVLKLEGQGGLSA